MTTVIKLPDRHHLVYVVLCDEDGTVLVDKYSGSQIAPGEKPLLRRLPSWSLAEDEAEGWNAAARRAYREVTNTNQSELC